MNISLHSTFCLSTHPLIDTWVVSTFIPSQVTGDRSKVRCCKEQYCIGTWNVRSMNQGKLEVVKQEIARVNLDILGISEINWTGMGEFNSMTIISTTMGKNPSREINSHHSKENTPKCNTWVQSQKRQNHLCSFSRQAIQYHSNTSLCPNQ